VIALHTEPQRERWLAFVKAQPLPLEVESKPWAKPRTLPQNSYLWSAVYAPLVKACGHTSEEWHEHYCGEFWGWVEHIKPSGHIEYKPLRTTTKNEHGKRDVLKGKPFSDFVVFVESDCAKRGVFIEEQWTG
jgi:hypothetical protein